MIPALLLARLPLGLLLAASLLLGPAALGAADAGAKPAKQSKSRYFSTKGGVVLTPEVFEKVEAIAKIYYAKTRRKLVITSGTRDPRDQADAMYKKLRAGSTLRGYRNQRAINPLKAVYSTGRRKRWKKRKIVDAMGKIIQGQVDRGVYISRHLKAGAVDIRSRGMKRKHKRALRIAIAKVGGCRMIEERRPPHFHLDIR
ncbi:MAG: hypothetical protein ACI9MR_000585 [Myxococcota bacterium]|jgi:hypothetical protein